MLGSLRWIGKVGVWLALSTGFSVSLATAQPSEIKVREAYRAACLAPNDSAKVESFYRAAEALHRSDASRPLHKGMLATAQMMRAEPQMNPFAKLECFNAGKEPLESAIASDRENADLRLFRLSVQWKVPFFLDYNDRMEEDLNHVAAALQSGFWRDDPEHAAFALTFIQHIRDDHSQ